MKTCPDCNGDDVIDKGTNDEKQCPMCGGSGLNRRGYDAANGPDRGRAWRVVQ